MENITNKIIGFIEVFNPKDDKHIIILSIIICLFLGYFFVTISATSIEDTYITQKSEIRNICIKIIMLEIVFATKNFVLLFDSKLIGFIWICGFIFSVFYEIYKVKEKRTAQDMENIEELNDYYKEKVSINGVMCIMCIVPIIAFIIHFRIGSNISELTCAVIAGIIEVAIIFMFDPEFIKRKSINYFLDNGKKMYIYRRVDEETVLCGDDPFINKAKKYKSISYNEFKRLEINHVVYRKLSSSRKRELRRLYNGRRNQRIINRIKIWLIEHLHKCP